MTLAEFEINYYVATGIGYLTLEFIEEGIPETYDEKIEYFIKLECYIQLLKNHCFEGQIRKYGRFDINGNASDLTQKLIEIIFGTSENNKIDNDENTTTTTLISAHDSLEDIGDDDKEANRLYLVKTDIKHIYSGYTYNDNAFQKSNTQYYILNTDNTLNYTTQVEDTIATSDLELPENITNYNDLTVIYQVNTNAYIEFNYDDTTNTFVKTDTAFNDGDNTIDVGLDYILDDDKEYIITDDGRKILVW